MAQARILDERLAQQKESLSLAILLDIPREAIEARVMDRWVHVPSGRTYSASFNPPRRLGLDDETGDLLTRRHDDNTVRPRNWPTTPDGSLLNCGCRPRLPSASIII